jgi:hypothetical protein
MLTAEQEAERDRQIAPEEKTWRDRHREKEQAKRSADHAWRKTPRGRATSTRATAKYQRTHKKKVASTQERYLTRKKLRHGSRKFVRVRSRRPNAHRNPDAPRSVLASTLHRTIVAPMPVRYSRRGILARCTLKSCHPLIFPCIRSKSLSFMYQQAIIGLGN